jgi:hypothetical protein
MPARTTFVRLGLGMATVAAACLGLSVASGQQANRFNEREVRSTPSALDKGDVWAFDFRFKDPRIIKVHIPGRGTRIVWYVWYQVINRTGEPRDFVPTFELVTHDYPGVYHDEVLSSVQNAVKRIEDPTGYQDIKNSVEISVRPIPVSKPPGEAFPRAVTGVAWWDASAADPKKRDPKTRSLADTTQFSIFVQGLSNGYVIVDPPAPNLQPVTRYKTLQLKFRREGERFSTDSRDIKFLPPAEWIYRADRRNPLEEALKNDEPKVQKKEVKKDK